MILLWGIKTLISQKIVTISSIIGISFSFFLALFFAAVWHGETRQIIAYPNKLKPDLWVMQDGVANMHMAMSFIWDWKADVIRQFPEVEKVTGFLYINTVMQVDAHRLFGFVVGLPDKESPAGPWQISTGRNLRSSDEIIVPDPMMSIYGLKLGESIRIIDHDYRVVGFSKGTYSSANPVFFVLKSELEKSVSSEGMLSYILVYVKPGESIKKIRQKIHSNIDKVNVLTPQEFVANDYAMATQMGAETILIMMLICSVLSALIVGYACYTLVNKKRKEIAIIKAVGARDVDLVLVVVLQSILVTLLAYCLALILLLLISVVLPSIAPQITLGLSWALVLQPATLAILIAVLGSLSTAIRLVKLDPAMAYKNG